MERLTVNADFIVNRPRTFAKRGLHTSRPLLDRIRALLPVDLYSSLQVSSGGKNWLLRGPRSGVRIRLCGKVHFEIGYNGRWIARSNSRPGREVYWSDLEIKTLILGYLGIAW